MLRIFYSSTLRLRRQLNAHTLGIALLLNASAFAADHPLDPLSQEEIVTTVQVLKTTAKVTDATRYMSIALREPPKNEVLKFIAGTAFSRQAAVEVHEHGTKQSFEAVVDLNAKKLVSWKELRGVQPAFPDDEEIAIVAKALRDDSRWQEALARRGITDFDAVTVDPWPVGYYGISDETGGRMVNGIPYFRGRTVNYFARPIEGLRAMVDLDSGKEQSGCASAVGV